jgi:hypothetical protein
MRGKPQHFGFKALNLEAIVVAGLGNTRIQVVFMASQHAPVVVATAAVSRDSSHKVDFHFASFEAPLVSAVQGAFLRLPSLEKLRAGLPSTSPNLCFDTHVVPVRRCVPRVLLKPLSTALC